MPAFTFEKISSPVRDTTTSVTIKANSKQVAAKKSRGLIVQMLDRFAVARLNRDETAAAALPRKRPPPD
ncbi:MAG: hypothetical protein Q7T73_11060 [Beijerinckiaceae bacterium]|nr:hypothetical protein [Beijerinckiaceae bacterium]